MAIIELILNLTLNTTLDQRCYFSSHALAPTRNLQLHITICWSSNVPINPMDECMLIFWRHLTYSIVIQSIYCHYFLTTNIVTALKTTFFNFGKDRMNKITGENVSVIIKQLKAFGNCTDQSKAPVDVLPLHLLGARIQASVCP